MKKRILSLLVALLLISTAIPTVNATELDRKDCSLTITMHFGDKNVPGGELMIYRVGYIIEEKGEYVFRRVTDGRKLTNVLSSSMAENLKEYVDGRNDIVSKKVPIGTGETDCGVAEFLGLETGLYLVVQTKAADGFLPISPFLVSVPYNSDGEPDHTVEITSKSPLVPEDSPSTTPSTEPSKPGGGKLPQTGQLNWPVPVMVVLGLGLFAAGWVLCFGRKKDGYEK